MENIMWNPLVSIIIPVFNGSNFLHEAIESALAQTYKNIEILVINDGSNDEGETERIALSFGNKIRYFSKENGGVATALNLGIENMRGEYFSWLSHDDLYMKNKISYQINILSELDDKLTILACGFKIIDENGLCIHEFDYLKGPFSHQMNIPLFALFLNAIHGCTLLIHKNHFCRTGLFDPNKVTTQDYVLWFKMWRGQNFLFHDGLLVLAREHRKRSSKVNFELHTKECDELWFDMVKSLSEQEMIQLKGSVVDFYLWRLEIINNNVYSMPLLKTASYLRQQLINCKDVSYTLKIDLLIEELKNDINIKDYEKLFKTYEKLYNEFEYLKNEFDNQKINFEKLLYERNNILSSKDYRIGHKIITLFCFIENKIRTIFNKINDLY